MNWLTQVTGEVNDYMKSESPTVGWLTAILNNHSSSNAHLNSLKSQFTAEFAYLSSQERPVRSWSSVSSTPHKELSRRSIYK